MERVCDAHPKPMTDEWSGQPHSTRPADCAALETQERAEQVQDTYERLHALATVTRQIFWTARPDGMSEDSPFWRAYTGQTSDDLRELGWIDAIHPEDRERTRACWLQAVATRRFFETEYRIRRADGVYQPFLVRGVPLLDEAGNIREWVGVCTDISERKQLEERLQKSEAHFRTIFEHAPVGIANATLEGRWFDVNQQLCDLLGYTRDELLARSFQGITHPDDLNASLDPYPQLLAGQCQSYALEKRYLHKDGSPLWVNVTISLVRTPEGMPYQTIAIIEDISQRKQLEEEREHLLEREQQARAEAAARASQLEATIEAMTEGVGIYTPEGSALLTNSSGRNILGINDPNQFRGFTSRSHPERLALLHCRDKDGHPYPPEHSPLTRALQGEVVPDAKSEDMLITALDGHERYLNSAAAPIRDTRGQLAGAVFVYRDVTERRLLERRTQDALGAMLDMAEALVAPAGLEERLFDEDTGVSISPMAQHLAKLTARVLGYKRVGMAVVDPETTQIVPLAVVSPSPQERRQWWERRRYAPRLSESSDPSLVKRLSAGEVMLLDTRRSPFSEPHPFKLPSLLIAPMRVGEQLVGLLSIGNDSAGQGYTPQDIALAGAIAKLTALVIERNRLLRLREKAQASALAIRETNRQLETFLGMASHELMTPLTSILMGQEMLQRRLQRLLNALAGSPEDVARQVRAGQVLMDTTHQQAKRLNRLVNDLLDTSRIQEECLNLQIAPVDLVTIVCSVVEEQRQVAPERQILLHLPSRSVLVQADAERIGQVVTNYLTNALKYSSEDCPVTVGLGVQEQQAHLWVRDQGPGIPPGEQERVWERFHRVPGIEIQSGSGVGLGIGLHISKTIIEHHGGQVGVQSTRGVGSIFWFTLSLEPTDQDLY